MNPLNDPGPSAPAPAGEAVSPSLDDLQRSFALILAGQELRDVTQRRIALALESLADSLAVLTCHVMGARK